MKVEDLKFDKRNYRKHDDKNRELIKKSINEVGFGRSIVIDNENEIVCGNGVVSQIAKSTPIKVIETNGSELIVVKRTDLNTNDEKRKQLAVMDNSTSDSSEFDFELLQEDFDTEELEDWGLDVDFEIEEEEKEVVEDEKENINKDLDNEKQMTHRQKLNNWFNQDKINFYSNLSYGIPFIKKEDDIEFDDLIGWNYRNVENKNNACHFFLEDYMFSAVWNNPELYIEQLKSFKAVLTPDFSLYTDYPIAIQIYNTFRNRWLGAYWQELGLKVIPTIVWSDEKSFDFCFEGVEKGSTVAISTVGVMKNKQYQELFIQGYEQMLEIIKPTNIIAYGNNIENLKKQEIIKWYNPFEKTIQERRIKNGR